MNTAFDFPVTVLARPGSGTTTHVLTGVANYASNDGREFPPFARYIACESNDDCLDQTLSTRGSLYWVSSAWMRTQPPQYLRVLSILEGDEVSINPLRDAVDLNRYPADLQRPLFMYVLRSATTTDESLRHAVDYLRYVRGVNGQLALEDSFFYNHFNEPIDVDVTLPDGFPAFRSVDRRLCLEGVA